MEKHIKSKDSNRKRIKLFFRLVDKNVFYETAESILIGLDNPSDLAECARIVEQREPGSTFYKSMFWWKIQQILNSLEDVQESKKEFLKICRQVEVHPRRARKYITWGQAIESVKESSVLREAPEMLFQNAQRQKEGISTYLSEAANILKENPLASPHQIHKKWCQQYGSIVKNLDIIKPSDWWAFGQPKWQKEPDFAGSIPGEIYANALYYFAPKKGIAVDPMAGSGMLKRVYEDRHLWQKDSNFNLEILLYDLEPYNDSITMHDARQPLPIMADWIFIDPPYFGQSGHLFHDEFASTKDEKQYIVMLKKVIMAMAKSLYENGILCIFLPKWSGTKPDDPNTNFPTKAYTFALESGLSWIDTAYVSRGRQQNPGSAIQNNKAKEDRRMRSDTCVLNVFQK